MTHNRTRSTLWGAVVALLVIFLSLGSAGVAAADTTPAWTGTFDNFHTSNWNSSWGLTSDATQCAIAVGTYNCNWGYDNLQAVSDPSSPNGQALKVTYPAKSGPPSCYKSVSGCVLGGAQFYQDLTTNGQTALHNSPTIDLKYYYNFPVGFDFGGKTAGKMPGLYGGIPGCESGGQRCSDGWSTRYMWRDGSKTAPNGELYFYGGSGDGYGDDLCEGKWTFPADGKWHSIEQLVNTTSGQVTIWSDGKSVCTTKQTFASPVSGVFFSTFHGGHDLSWSPTKTTTSEFADFTLSTDGPQGGGGGGGTAPATPTALKVASSTDNSINLSWKETNNSDPAASYKIYEGSTVVGTSTKASATVSGLAAGSTHTYTVTAVNAAGGESPPSASVTGKTTGTAGTAKVSIKKSTSGKNFTDTATVTNAGSTAINGWTVQLDLDATMAITKGSKVTVSSSGNHYTLTATSADAKIAAGAKVTFTFTGTFTKSYKAPTNVTVTVTG